MRFRNIAAVIVPAVLLFAVASPVTRATAAGSLPLKWSTTVGEGPASSNPANSPAEPWAGATVGDLFGDGRKEVVAAFHDGSVWAFDGSTGAVLPGWPQYTGGPIHTNPSLADLNNDGREEVIASSESGRVYVWNANGTWFPGWPQHSWPLAPNVPPGFFGGVAVGDLFGDGNKELVAAGWDQHLWAWNKNGGVLPGFPIHMYDTSWSTPALVDLQHTGRLDIVVGNDSSGAPWGPYQSGGVVWAFPPTGCNTAYFPDQTGCQLPGWPKSFDQVAWASPAATDLHGDGNIDVIEGTGLNFGDPRGHYVNVWNAGGGSFGSWPGWTGGRNIASPAVGDLFGDGHREVVEPSTDGYLYAWNPDGYLLGGYPVNLNNGYMHSYPSIGPINSTSNGVWIINSARLQAYDNAGHLVYNTPGLDWGGFAAPTIADLSGTGEMSVITLDQANGSATAWTVKAFNIPGTNGMLPGAWPQFHGNARLTGTIEPSATMNGLGGTQYTTQATLSWNVSDWSVRSYTVWVKDEGYSNWMVYGRTGSRSITFNGYPGHTYDFSVQPEGGEVNFASGTARTTFSGSASWVTPFQALYGADAHGLLHGGSSAPLQNPNSWPSWDVVRGIALTPDGQGGYMLDAFGGVHALGNAPSVQTTGYWPGWDITRGIALAADGHSGYVLDGWGGLHPFGTLGDIPPPVQTSGFWPGWDIARDVQLTANGLNGYVLDGYGGLHPFGVGGVPAGAHITGFFPGWDIAHRFSINSSGTGGYVLDGWGGLHPFGLAGNAPPSAPRITGYWSGWDIARGVVILPGSSGQGYVIDGVGGFHPFGNAPGVTSPTYGLGGQVKDLSIA